MSVDPILKSLESLTTEAGGEPGKTHYVNVGVGALDAVTPWVQANTGAKAQRIICDAHTRKAAAEQLAAKLRDAGLETTLLVLEPASGDDHVVCDDAAIARVNAQLADRPEENVIAVGAGTVNDIAKMATFQLGRPYQCVATAASMNGYTSSIAAVLSGGVKRTLPAQQAQAVFADTDVLCSAPAYLNLAGFGDLLSKPYSNADWKLSSMIRGVAFEDRPAQLLDTAFALLLERAEAIGSSTPDGIETLAATIVLSGFTMAIAGTSAPASGGEHLVSHYWDMEQHCHGKPLFALHGTQVGIATRMSALLFERLMQVTPEDIDPKKLALGRAVPDAAAFAALHPRLTADVAQEVRQQFVSKQRTGAALVEELTLVRDAWEGIRGELSKILMPSASMTAGLAAAGAPSRPSAIGVERRHAVRTLQYCRHIRSRYVALDLLADLGLLEDLAPRVVDNVEQN